MTTIFVLEDENLPEASALEGQLTRLAGRRYVIERVEGKAALQEKLATTRQAVVVFSAPVPGIPTFVQQCRFALPGTACIALIKETDFSRIPVLEMDCHLLQSPVDDFALLNQLSAAVRQAEMLATLSDAAQVDEITSLYNRRYFMHRLGEEISLAKRHLSPVSCVVMGINCYRMYLDSYGYDFINALLRFIADTVNSLARHEDVVARIGDDEIGILLPRSTEKGAKIFTNRLILSLNASMFRYGGYEEEISVSAGIAGFPLPDDSHADADTIIRYARHALHQARCSDEDNIAVRLFSEIKPAL